MAHPNPYPRCIWCGAKANSRQHAIPAWMARRFGWRGVFLYAGTAVNLPALRHPLSVASHRGRITCKDCNTFFKHLEDQIADTLTWMARGRPLQLDTEQVALLAAWGAKTGIELIAIQEGFRELVPVEHRHALRQTEQPTDECWVGYLSWGGRLNKFVGEHSFGPPTKPEEAETMYRAYTAILTFEKLAFKLFGLIDGPVPGYALRWDNASIRQAWPPIHLNLSWPLFPEAQEGNLDGLTELLPIVPST